MILESLMLTRSALTNLGELPNFIIQLLNWWMEQSITKLSVLMILEMQMSAFNQFLKWSSKSY